MNGSILMMFWLLFLLAGWATFQRMRTERLKQQLAEFDALDRDIADANAFIERFGYGITKIDHRASNVA